MPAVTVTSYRSNVDGSYRESMYTLNIANTGDTLTTPLRTIKSVSVNDGAVTKSAVSGGVITFTTTGAVTGLLVKATGL
jgi:hypothetical protein